MGMNGHDYNGFLDDIINHKAVVSPRGNGLDCHRTWEALYLKRAPIMKWTPSIHTFDLPIVWLPSWDALAFRKSDVLAEIDACLQDIYENKNMQALSMKYWIKRIRNAE